MDIFGEAWLGHAERMARSWDARVEPGDTVLLPGDLSWARDLDEARPDLDWLARRPGRKLLLRGNHDGWWTSLEKLRRALPSCCEPLQNNALEAAGWVVVGARGWTSPDDPLANDGDGRIFRREIERLKLSVAHADREFGTERPRVAMLHYPPWIEGREPTAVVEILERARTRICVYGHLHGEDHRLAVTGSRRGILFRLVAADAVDFSPVEIARADPG
jgi:predicted phosphohydrolase